MAEQTIQTQITARSLKDATFRQEMLTDPKAVLAREYNVQVPEHITVRVIEEQPDTLSLVVPPALSDVEELSDADLEAVAGGAEATTTIHVNSAVLECNVIIIEK